MIEEGGSLQWSNLQHSKPTQPVESWDANAGQRRLPSQLWPSRRPATSTHWERGNQSSATFTSPHLYLFLKQVIPLLCLQLTSIDCTVVANYFTFFNSYLGEQFGQATERRTGKSEEELRTGEVKCVAMSEQGRLLNELTSSSSATSQVVKNEAAAAGCSGEERKKKTSRHDAALSAANWLTECVHGCGRHWHPPSNNNNNAAISCQEGKEGSPRKKEEREGAIYISLLALCCIYSQEAFVAGVSWSSGSLADAFWLFILQTNAVVRSKGQSASTSNTWHQELLINTNTWTSWHVHQTRALVKNLVLRYTGSWSTGVEVTIKGSAAKAHYHD